MATHDQKTQNLDILCAEKGRVLAQIPGMEERILNAALAVLEEQGPYAMLLYLKARHSKEFGKAEEVFKGLLCDVFRDKFSKQADALAMISTLAQNLDDLLFAQDLLRMTLSYARYHLKAKGGSTS